MNTDEPWYAVRCLFEHPYRKHEGEDHLYEERITLWKASSFEEAYSKAEKEAREYANGDDCIFISTSNAFHIFDTVISEGSEVYSTMRGSNLSADLYKKTFCSTPMDRTQNAPPFGERP